MSDKYFVLLGAEARINTIGKIIFDYRIYLYFLNIDISLSYFMKIKYLKDIYIMARTKYGGAGKRIKSLIDKRQTRAIRRINAILKPQMNFFDVDIPLATVTGTGDMNCLTLISQGPSDGMRLGDSVGISRIEIRYEADVNAVAVVNSLRCIVFRDTNTNGVFPVADDVLQFVGGFSSFSPFEHSTQDRFHILYDHVHTMVNTSETTMIKGKFIKNIKIPKRTTYIGNGFAVANLISNHYYVLFISDDAVNGPVVAGKARLIYAM